MRTLVESCSIVDTKTLKKDLRGAREQKTGINGSINIELGGRKSAVDYYFEYGVEFDYLVIQYGETEQRIKLAISELYFGARSWFICECDRRVAKLYLPPESKQFKCRYCHNLAYELTTFSRNSKHGKLLYQTNRINKMINTREQMRSVIYDGKLTERFNRFLKLADGAGITNVREDANKLMAALKNF